MWDKNAGTKKVKDNLVCVYVCVCVCAFVNACMCLSEVKLIFFYAAQPEVSKQTGSKRKNSNNTWE